MQWGKLQTAACVVVGHARLYLAGDCEVRRGATGCGIFNVSSKTRFDLGDVSTVVTDVLFCCLRLLRRTFYFFRLCVCIFVVVNTRNPANTLLPSCFFFCCCFFNSYIQQMILSKTKYIKKKVLAKML